MIYIIEVVVHGDKKAVVPGGLEDWRRMGQDQVEEEIAGRMVAYLAAGEIIGMLREERLL